MAELVSAHNEGFNKLAITDVMSIIKGSRTVSPSTLENMKLEFDEKENTIHFYQDGTNITFSITENEYYTLAMIEDKQEIGDGALLLPGIFNY